MATQPPRGFYDLLPPIASQLHELCDTGLKAMELFGYKLYQTPCVEMASVFDRSLGEDSDIVHKEMFRFQNRKEEWLCLRPEGTAGIARLIATHKLGRELPLKMIYYGPMFRYERPQKGRQRQFHQFGLERLGSSTALSESEVIQSSHAFLKALDLDASCKLEINTLGDDDSREAYKQTLVAYFEPLKEKLSDDSQRRLDTNPLRILDSKAPEDQDIVTNAPKLADSLNEESQSHFKKVLVLLDEMKIPYTINPKLVRGLDYYSHTVFEWTTDKLGTQSAVLAGGRYDKLTKQMGGATLQGIGWAAGLERLMLLKQEINNTKTKTVTDVEPKIGVLILDPKAQGAALRLTSKLRAANKTCEIYEGKANKLSEKAKKRGCTSFIFLGEQEVLDGVATIKTPQQEDKKINL